jgi:hypothetical protein
MGELIKLPLVRLKRFHDNDIWKRLRQCTTVSHCEPVRCARPHMGAHLKTELAAVRARDCYPGRSRTNFGAHWCKHRNWRPSTLE